MNLDNIFANFFNNTASKEELENLERWKAESDENIKALKEMENIWKLSDDMKEYKSFNTSKALMKVNSKIVDQELAKETQKPKSIIRYLMPLAASLVLIAAVVWGVQNFQSGEARITQYVAEQEVKNITLEDNSIITLDKEAKINLVSSFENTRDVEVEGRVYFDVSKDKMRPFKIITENGTISVLGTQFVVESDLNSTIVYLKEGEVSFTHNSRVVQLLPGDAVRSDDQGITKFKVLITNIDSWRSNTLSFEKTKVSDLFQTLSKHFDLELDIKNKGFQFDCSISSTYNNMGIKEILDELKLVFDIKYTLKNGRLTIHTLSC